MTRQGRSPGHKPRVAGGGRIDDELRLRGRAVGADHMDEARIKAKWYLYRTGNRDLWEVLGLVEDPVVAERARAKALRDMGAINRGGAR